MGGYHKMEERAFRLLNSIQVVLEITLDDRTTIVFAGNTNSRARRDRYNYGRQAADSAYVALQPRQRRK